MLRFGRVGDGSPESWKRVPQTRVKVVVTDSDRRGVGRRGATPVERCIHTCPTAVGRLLTRCPRPNEAKVGLCDVEAG